VLHDDGTAPDARGGDSVFSARLQFTVALMDAGTLRIRFVARSTEGLESNTIEEPLFISRRNSTPRLSNLSAPDSVTLPIGESTLIRMSVVASDSDGLSDIREVYFRSLDSSNPLKRFPLLDDGNSSNDGDSAAGDGIFTILIQLDPSTTRKTYRFAFQATDAVGDTSATILHLLTVR
jgi:hypothetical protein